MKPLALEVSAFGSFADVQAIDFAQLGANGLYLITGDTGAGKTTIFDAISFVLFGRASGDGRSDYAVLRSDFAEEGAKTYVELSFLSGNNRYRIKRTIKNAGQDVELSLPDGTRMSGNRTVTQKIAEIIGLDREQFAQIVMIAQNDFLRFLQSSTDERLKILRHIFGTEALRRFQEQLKALARRESERRALILYDFERHEVDAYKRDETFALWEAQIKSDQAGLAGIVKLLDKYDRRKQELAAALAVAEELCKKFGGLAKCRADLEAHSMKAGEIAKIRERSSRGEVALYKAKPLSDEMAKAASDHGGAQAGLARAREQEASAAAGLVEALGEIEGLPPLAEAQAALAALTKEWEAAAEKLSRLTALKANHDEITCKQDTLGKTEADLADALEALANLPPIAGRQAELDDLAARLKNDERKLIRLTELGDGFHSISAKRAALKKGQDEFAAVKAEFDAADAKHRSMEESFLCNQAGILADGLVDGEPCPVCGSKAHPAPAEVSDGSVTEALLKKARESKEKARLKREGKSAGCAALLVEIETLTKRFNADLAGVMPGAAGGEAAALLPAETEKTRLSVSGLSGEKTAKEASLEGLKLSFEEKSALRDELTPLTASLKSEIDTLKKRLIADLAEFVPGAKWDESGQEISSLLADTRLEAGELAARKERDKSQVEVLAAKWGAATARKHDAESAAHSAQTLVAERAGNELRLRDISVATQAAFAAALREHGFGGEAEYRAALVTEGELAGMKKAAQEYEKTGEQLSRDIGRLETETRDRAKPDLELMRSEAETARSESKRLGEERDEINNRLRITEGALKDLRRAAKDFEKAEKSYASVKQLADAANGKLDFETYAQMAYFERVLRAANLRLKSMSQNRYALLRKTGSDDGRRRSGLEIEVMDAYTGKARPANTLSGGESFMASLSLALGLSDIVQQSAGGIRLDAMFIDEGFGSLDVEVLELAIRTLSDMAGADRIIGIISHVSELRERIDKQIQVAKTTKGSKISLAV